MEHGFERHFESWTPNEAGKQKQELDVSCKISFKGTPMARGWSGVFDVSA